MKTQLAYTLIDARFPCVHVLRVWERDGSVNRMSLGRAVDALMYAGTCQYSAEETAKRLMSGQRLTTARATFVLEVLDHE